MQIRFLTSWDERCGIAQYSRGLVDELRRSATVEIVPATFRRSPRAVYRAMGVALNAGEIAHVQHSYAFFGGLHPLRSGWSALAEVVRRPLLLTVHELDTRATPGRRLPPAVEVAYKRQYNRSVFLHPAVRHLVVHSPVLRDELLDLGAPAERVSYLPMPMDPPPAHPVNPAPFMRKLGLAGKRPLMILGFLARRKGYDVAIQALRALPEEYVLVAAGGEHEADATGTEAWLRSEARRAGVEHRVVVTGYLAEEELELATAAADLVLAPFLEMSASASLAFALARGKAVIASDLAPNRGLDCVRLVPRGDASALAEAVRTVSESPAVKRELERVALQHARNHTYGALAEETIALYDQLLGVEAR